MPSDNTELEELDNWLDGLLTAKHGKVTKAPAERAWIENVAIYRRPPVTVGYLYVTRVCHCMKCGEVTPHFEGVYRAETEVGMRANSLIQVKCATLQAGLPTHSVMRHRNVEQCHACIPTYQTPLLTHFEGLLQ